MSQSISVMPQGLLCFKPIEEAKSGVYRLHICHVLPHTKFKLRYVSLLLYIASFLTRRRNTANNEIRCELLKCTFYPFMVTSQHCR